MGDLQEFVGNYYETFADTLRRFDKSGLDGILDVLLEVANADATLWVAGNGGSAAIADHTVCDMSKGTHTPPEHPPIRSVSLASNGPMVTAIGNDIGYEQIFRQQLEYYLGPKDAVLLVSSSGNSPNVVEACVYAKQRGVPTIAFVGFRGGKLKEIADHVVHVEIDNYGIAEDTHQSVMHVLTQYIKARRDAEPA